MSIDQSFETPSPCIKLCTLDATGSLCLGCGRTVAEISGWGRMDETGKQAVVARLAARVRPTRSGRPPRARRVAV
jgi:predicted Fe-S protein YdhL (DUF1289 family)